MKDEPRTSTRHQRDHAVPTVIHHPEENMPVLARWVHHAMENRARFWGVLGGLVAAVVGLAVLVNVLDLGHSAGSEAWEKLEQAKTPSERVELAQDYPNTEAERWALLLAATEYYNQGFADLPSNRDVALPVLKKAADLFKRVESESPADAPQTRVAALGLAQTYEARNELDKAIEQYQRVAKLWKDSEEARQAEAKIEVLKKPETLLFYKELYTYKAPEITLPPGGQGGIPLPPDHPPLDGPSMIPPPPPLTLPALPVETKPAPAPQPQPQPQPETAAPKPALPEDVFAPATSPAPAPAPAPGKPGEPKG
jgi:hypothetical protein